MWGQINYAAEWNATIFGREIRYTRRSKDEPMGRFGAGWDWRIGVQWGGSSMIISLLVAELRINFKRSDND